MPDRRKESGENALHVRFAEEKDWPEISKLVLQLFRHSIPKTRPFFPKEYEAGVKKAMSSLEARARIDPDFCALCLLQGDKLIGYCFLYLGKRNPILLARHAFIIDIGIMQAFWGKFYWRPLIEAALRVAGKKGFRFAGGIITAENLRSIAPATRFLGFQHAGVQWAKKLSP